MTASTRQTPARLSLNGRVLVMGVAGCGKSTLAAALAQALGATLIEGDDHHPPASRAKMHRGEPLDDADRAPWLDRLGVLMAASQQAGPAAVVLACSALKRAHRDRLRAAVPGLRTVYVEIDLALALARVAARAGHFFPPALVASQFDALEPPQAEAQVLTLRAEQPLAAQLRDALCWLAH
ncbi:MAG: gluconokinase [Leptothrix sp. (in: b-proteobacteria)]